MTLKSKISLYISISFTILFGISCAFIVNRFAQFRKDEFKDRLHEKALTTIRLLVEVNEVDNALLKIIDQNTIHKLYNEKTLVFDSNRKLIYSSLDDTKIKWTESDLVHLKNYKTFFKKDGDKEIYGVLYTQNNNTYYALISAEDSYGKRKLNFLIFLTLITGAFFITLTWIITFYIVKKQLKPLEDFHEKIRHINDLNIHETLKTESTSKNEINLLSNEFNHMMNRINEVYQQQKEFTAHASHELRTPLTRISVQIENQIKQADPKEVAFLSNIFQDIDQLKELINALLILSKLENQTVSQHEKTRIDEALFNSFEKISTEFKDLKIDFNFSNLDFSDHLLEITCNPQLLELAFYNLLKNAYRYANHKSIKVSILTENNKIMVRFENDGPTIPEQEQPEIFQAFKRGSNAAQTKGLGLGLKIVRQILESYHFQISYQIEDGKNVFNLIF